MIATLLLILYNFTVICVESTEHPLFPTLLATITPFTGAYQPLPGQPSSPSNWMSAGVFFSLFITMSALVTIFIKSVRIRSRRKLSLLGSRRSNKDRVLLIGDSTTAASIAQAIPEQKSFTHFTAHAHSERSWEVPLDASGPLYDTALTKSAQRANTIIVATEDTAENIQIAEKLAAKIDTAKTEITCLVSDSQLSNQLRPTTITGTPPEIDLFNPEENIAQHVAELVMFLTTSSIRKNEPITVNIVENVTSDIIGSVVKSWLDTTKNSIKCIRESNTPTFEEKYIKIPPEIKVNKTCQTYNTNKPEYADISIILGTEEYVAVEALERARDSIDDIVIAVTRPELLRPIGSKSTWTDSTTASEDNLRDTRTICVNPDAIANSLEEVRSGVIDRWARAYHLFYGMMVRDISRWNAQALGKNEQSSISAVKNMLNILDNHGYYLKRSKKDNSMFNPEIVESMAREEHDSWRKRTWIDSASRKIKRVTDKEPGDGVLDIEFDDLDQKYKEYNLRVPQEVYPAIATLFGYHIVPKDQTGV
ncbi:hypothetical protein V5S96_10840 [Corynebacterium mastitidis]|uniref:RCK N-terminal domain-containing protein n=1 Tax=Corynebacterium mastitidis TaxID=161890 RepID=A0ABU8P0P6_9CORY